MVSEKKLMNRFTNASGSFDVLISSLQQLLLSFL